ncbi:bifunctional anthranilate synthase component I family protein/class IV aminotransferase [Helicobacter mesocricetorum]|uniref:chorismate-binding protein n=1 Tax=Helicobacter mesocricetorum TaxID=87012 RepID=UPI000CF0FE8D|nr:bifunctional anthranilate synthase component I family protein/class IV aminotransferase [Helicobacter mesocricetorum]
MTIFGDYVYSKPLKHIFTFKKKDLPLCFKKIQKYSKYGYLVGYVSYEAGLFSSKEQKEYKKPLLEFILFKKRSLLSNSSLKTKALFYPTIKQGLNEEFYKHTFQKVKQNLKLGNTYQVNLTQELHLQSHCEGLEIFKALLHTQNTDYKAYFKTPFVEIISLSPELFFQLKKDKITLEPMKGTIKRGKNKQEDKKNKKSLKQDSKNISENIMIVDLLRNDISQIAKLHTLKIKSLLTIKTYPTLHQMVSKLQAKIPNQPLYKIFSALFPCGSITGAPKKSTMDIIQNLELRDRGVYCGAIGVITKNKACFNVPIRTLMKYQDEDFYRYGVGSGIVWDSKWEEEFKELQLKSQFLFPHNFKLLETILVRGNQAFLLSYHLKRILKSAKDFGFYCPKFLEDSYEALCSKNLNMMKNFQAFEPLLSKIGWQSIPDILLPFLQRDSKPSILRLLLDQKILFEQTPYTPICSYNIAFAKDCIYSHNDLLYHKTTLRRHFTKTPNQKIFDYIYTNEKGEITEGSRSNIIILKNNTFLTPPRKSGLLGGCIRQFLLDSKLIYEKTLLKKDLLEAEKIFCTNALRGIVEVTINAQKNTSD